MGLHLRRAAALALAGFVLAAPARADTVELKDGTVIERVRATRQGDRVVVAREIGSTTFAAKDVAEIRQDIEWRDTFELAELKCRAGDDPAALRAVAAWCAEHGFDKEARDLRELARGADLDRRLDAAAAQPDRASRIQAFLAIVADARELGLGEDERRAVLERALACDPEDATVRRALGQTKRDGKWMSFADAARFDEEAEAQAMRAKGLVEFEGRWLAPEAVAAIQTQRALEEEAREREAEREQRRAARRAARLAAAEARESAQDAPYFIPAMSR